MNDYAYLGGYLPINYGPTARSSISDGTLPAQVIFYTWREAILTAVEASRKHCTKAKVYKLAGRWVLDYRYTPVSMNGGAS